MTTIHFIRHGEVENPDNIFYGRLPGFPLNSAGKACIEYTAKQLSRFPIQAVYTSPLLRTKQTAAIIGQAFVLPIIEDERLIEIATMYEGQPKGYETRVLHYPPERTEGTETMPDIYDRMASFARTKTRDHPNAHIVAVSHGGAIRILEMGLLHEPFNDWSYDQEEVPICGSDLIVTVKDLDIKVIRADL